MRDRYFVGVATNDLLRFLTRDSDWIAKICAGLVKEGEGGIGISVGGPSGGGAVGGGTGGGRGSSAPGSVAVRDADALSNTVSPEEERETELTDNVVTALKMAAAASSFASIMQVMNLSCEDFVSHYALIVSALGVVCLLWLRVNPCCSWVYVLLSLLVHFCWYISVGNLPGAGG